MTTVNNDTELQQLITNSIIAAASKAPEPPKNNDEYRFYHCHLHWNGLEM